MRVLHGLNNFPKFNNPVVALGVFDGLHRGHLNILRAAVKKARVIRGTSIVVTFHPHPRREKSIYSLEHRLRLIEEQGIDVCLVINFSRHFSGLSAQSFIRDILCKRIGAKAVYVGENFRFGKDAGGDVSTLKYFSKECGFCFKSFKVIRAGGKAISSTYIRSLIRAGKLSEAQRLLTRRVSILGTVIRGQSLAKKFGFPTANINPHHEVIPPDGIYAVQVGLDNKRLKGVCYIGTRPTIEALRENSSEDKRHIEVHIFGFNKNIYKKYLSINFIRKIREDKKFLSISALIEQIEKDIVSARKILIPHS